MFEIQSTGETALAETSFEETYFSSPLRDPAAMLHQMVQRIQEWFRVDVCSIYLLEPDRMHLILAASQGLRAESIGKVRMALHEGLAGMVAEHLRPIVVEDAFKHPRFKYFPDAGEDAYHSFLGLPLIDAGIIQGVLVVQTKEVREFVQDEIRAITKAAAKIAPTIREVRMLEQFIGPLRERLWALARNLWWCWNEEAVSLFSSLDPARWQKLDHNPILLLTELPTDALEERINQLFLQGRIHTAYRYLQDYLKPKTSWGLLHAGVLRARPVAYFSAEFGLHESLPIYSGGLGILAGDHIKSASDLDIPLIGIGLFYHQGYFRQKLNHDAWQEEDYLDIDPRRLPLSPALDPAGQPVVIRIETRTGVLRARVWQVAVGRCPLFLLDSNVEGNSREDRELTSRLYGGDDRVRIRQELLLGVGGMRALEAMNIHPGVLHLNEGHCGFALLECIGQRMVREGIDFNEARRRVSRQTVFTTHTPVPAGHDYFSPELMEDHLGPMRDTLGLSLDHLMNMGRVRPGDTGERFCMTVLCLKQARYTNAVSSLHGEVSRSMWNNLYPGRAEEEVPIGHITNGIHVPSWLAPPMHRLYDRHLGPQWPSHSGDARMWDKIDSIDDSEIWETHQALKTRLISFVRQRLVRQMENRKEPVAAVNRARQVLSMDALTIGFARRFATYKRANLILQDLEELAEWLNDPQKPVQLVFAGKAHPRDEPGKRVLQEIARLMKDRRFQDKIVFLEDYDINVGRHLVQGVDVWLNNPRKPLEASGTSGQKVILNGGLNLSVLDGWWAEAYDGGNGFAIGLGETHTNQDIHDRRDGLSLAKVLREEVIPLYYKRDAYGLPRGWIARMKRGIRTLGWRFSSDRMVMDYAMKKYIPAGGGLSSSE